MKTVGLEEHLVVADVLRAWQSLDPRWQDLAGAPSSKRDRQAFNLIQQHVTSFAASVSPLSFNQSTTCAISTLA